MITIKLTSDQAHELIYLLDSMNIEPVATGSTLIAIFDKPPDHPLWPVLDQLRNAVEWLPVTTVLCDCGKQIERSKRGEQPKRYCSAACKQKAVRKRAQLRKQTRPARSSS